MNLDIIKAHFPKLKIIARGNWLKAMGEAEEIALEYANIAYALHPSKIYEEWIIQVQQGN